MKEVKHTPEIKLPPLPWSIAKQKGKPGHCHAAQIFDVTGKAIIMIDPTEDEDDANQLAKFVSETAAERDRLKEEKEFYHKALLENQKMTTDQINENSKLKEELKAANQEIDYLRGDEIKKLREDLLQETGKCMKYQHEIAKLKEENERLKAELNKWSRPISYMDSIAEKANKIESINRELVDALNGLSHLMTGREDWPEVQRAQQALKNSTL